MMSKKLILILTILTVSINLFSYTKNVKDEYEVKYIKEAIHLNPAFQTQLIKSEDWQLFLSNNSNWFVYFNEFNQKPHRAFGEPISNSNGGAIEDIAFEFIQNQMNMFNIPLSDLFVNFMSENEKYNSVSFFQKYNGLDVIDSRLYVKMTKFNELISFGLDVFSDIELSVIPTIRTYDVILKASENLPFTITKSNVEENLKILPIPENGKYTYHLVYVVNLSTKNNIGPAEYLCYVDANSGELLMRRNEIKFEATQLQSSIHVEGEVYTSNTFNPSSIENCVDLKVKDLNTSMSYYTDNNGDVTIPSTIGTPLNISLQGRYSFVQTNSVIPSFTTSVSAVNNFVFDNSNSTIQERTAFYAINKIHSHFKNQFPTFLGLDFSMETNVDVGLQGGCNAFYGGGTINFLEEDGGCNATAKIPDVAYHEYGHAINDYRYNGGAGLWNGACGEGFADIWALSLTEYPVLGEGWLLNDPFSNVRTYDTFPKVYPQDLTGEVHADGEIICGAFWDTYINLGNMQQPLDMFSSLYDGGPDGPNGTEGVIFTDILLEFLYWDDNDGNIFNGTPNDIAIVDAFAKHGITLLSNAILTHTEITTATSNTNIDVDANINMTYPWALSDAYCFYKVNDATIWDSIPMALISGFDYTGQIPSQTGGTVVSYYLSIVDVYGKKSAITPFSSHLPKHANLPYFILVGYELQEEQDFDFNIGFWSTSDGDDNATTGHWLIGTPIGSYYDGVVPVQTSTQTTPGGSDCAFTGNDNTGGSIGANDVDGGKTTLTSPTYDLTDYDNPTFTYYRWYTNSPPTGANPGADWWQVLITDDGVNWVYIENNMSSDNRWRKFAFRVKDYVNITSNFKMKFIASDSIRLGQNLDGGSLIEAAIDDLYLYEGVNSTSVEELQISEFEIYPNPTNGVFFIKSDNFTTVNVKVINTLGELVLEKQIGIHDNKIDISNMSKGIYYLEFYNDKLIETKKIVLE